MIRSLVPPERLLEYKVGEGWNLLCNFLGCDVPAQELPSGNEKGVMSLRFRKALVLTLKAIIESFFKRLLFFGLVIYAAWGIYNRLLGLL